MSFVPVKGYEGYYLINRDGVVLNIKRDPKGVPITRVGKPHHAKRVCLRIPHEGSDNLRLDTLVATAFLGKTDRNKYLHNISGDLNDCSVDNLEYREYIQSNASIEPSLLKLMAYHYLKGNKTTKELAELANTKPTNASNKIKEWCNINGLKDEYIKRATANRDNAVKHTGTNQGKKVAQFNLDGIFLKSYKTVTIAAKSVGISVPTLSSALDQRTRTAGGFRWKSLSKILPSN